MKRGHIKSVVGKIGVGKESDIYKCLTPENEIVVLKLARLGRVSFRTIKNNRDYLKNRTQFNWLYLSRLASLKEFTFLEMLYKSGFPTPTPIDWNRHGIVMSLVDGYTMCNVKEVENKKKLYEDVLELLIKFAKHGLIHSDFNEFNLMVNDEGKLTVIDFPQMVSTSHPNADDYFNRDLECVLTFFSRRFSYEQDIDLPQLSEIEIEKRLDVEIKASGFIKKELKDRVDDLDILMDYENEKEPEEGEMLSEEEFDLEKDMEGLELSSIESDNEEKDEIEPKEGESEDEEEQDSESGPEGETKQERRERMQKELGDKKKKERKPRDEKEIVKREAKKKFTKRIPIKKNHEKLKQKIVANDYFF